MAKAAPKKIRGWLLFFVLVFVFAGIGEVSTFFYALSHDPKSSVDTINIILSPVIAVGLFLSTFLIVSHKKSALNLVYLTLGIMAVYAVIYNLTPNDLVSDSVRFVGLFTGPVVYVLLALYFKQSTRVKQTLVK